MSQPVGLTTGQHSSGTRPESAGRLVVFVYLIACAVTLRVRWSKNHYLLREQVMPAHLEVVFCWYPEVVVFFPFANPPESPTGAYPVNPKKCRNQNH